MSKKKNHIIQVCLMLYDVVSISVGYASYPNDSNDPEEVVRLADQALYNSKEHGKNRFEAYKR